MNKPLSREKLLKELTSYNYILENHLSNLVKSINAGRFDEDAPAFDVNKLKKLASEFLKCDKFFLEECICTDKVIEKINDKKSNTQLFISFIESKLKKEPEVAEVKVDGPVTYGAINSVDQYQHGIENKNLIDADELIEWLEMDARNFNNTPKVEIFARVISHIKSKLPAKEEEELKPCPFCGEKEELAYAEDLDDDGDDCF